MVQARLENKLKYDRLESIEAVPNNSSPWTGPKHRTYIQVYNAASCSKFLQW